MRTSTAEMTEAALDDKLVEVLKVGARHYRDLVAETGAHEAEVAKSLSRLSAGGRIHKRGPWWYPGPAPNHAGPELQPTPLDYQIVDLLGEMPDDVAEAAWRLVRWLKIREQAGKEKTP